MMCSLGLGRATINGHRCRGVGGWLGGLDWVGCGGVVQAKRSLDPVGMNTSWLRRLETFASI
jgi:hypothetical protein